MSDAAVTVTHSDECLRCGYNLIGIANERACPECGLLAERSRRVTDELHESRPRWLRRLSWGVWCILLALVTPVAGFFANSLLDGVIRELAWQRAGWWGLLAEYAPILPFDLGAILLTRGVWWLASPEGYGPADAADRRRRRALRLAVLGPWLALLIVHAYFLLNGSRLWRRMNDGTFLLLVLGLATVGSTPLVYLVARRLRDIASRARSAHLAEHCVIVGVGTAATLIYTLIAAAVTTYPEAFGLASDWGSRGVASLMLVLAMTTAGALFVLWQLYLLVRFAIAFGAASRRLRRQWWRDDRARPVAVEGDAGAARESPLTEG